MRQKHNFIALASNATIIERLRWHLESKDLYKRYFDKDVADVLGISQTNICSHKKRNDYVFKVVVLDWCVDHDIDPRKMVSK